MTYLLQSEVKLNQQQTDYESLSKRVETLSSLVLSSQTPFEIKSVTRCMQSKQDSQSSDFVSKDFTAPKGSESTPVMENFMTPHRVEHEAESTSNTQSSSTTVSQLSQKMGTSTSDWLFSTPMSGVKFSEKSEAVEVRHEPTEMVSKKDFKFVVRDDKESAVTPLVPATMTSEATPKTVDLFGRDKSIHRTPPLRTEATSGTPNIFGRAILNQSDPLASYDLEEKDTYFDLLRAKKNEDETDLLYQENLVSVARQLYAESVERSNTHDKDVSSSIDESILASDAPEPVSLPPRSPAPVTRVEKLQKSLLSKKYSTTSTSRTFLTDLQNSSERDEIFQPFKVNGVKGIEQPSFGTIPPPPPPLPHTAPIHPYLGSPGVGKSKLVFDATSGSY